jgi:hypothetical protein
MRSASCGSAVVSDLAGVIAAKPELDRLVA